MISYLYTKIPLFLFAIKKEEEIREEIVVYNIHFFSLLAYKSNAIIKKHK
jgi:LytS/YehU family sensor histidine kinase